jgi:hypothetical protein
MKIPVNLSGIDDTVDIKFFERLEIIEEKLIGDTYFIKTKCKSFFSVHKNFYDIIKRDLKIKKILKD